MKDFLESILGEYVPVTYEAIVDGTTYDIVASGVSGVDWLYVLSGIAFLMLIYCTFRVLGGLLCKIS